MPPKGPTAKARSSSNSAKAKGKAVAISKAPAPANALPVPTPVLASAPEQVGCYKGVPLNEESAEALLKSLSEEDMKALAESTLAEEQLPARMMLEFVGDKDLAWTNAQKSLRDGANFKKEMLEMEGSKFVTKGSIGRYDALGQLVPQALEGKQPAAFIMAVYLEAVIDAAKDKSDWKPKLPPPPEPDKEPPTWPIKVGIKDIPGALNDAIRWGKTPLFVCNGKSNTVDTFFQYQNCSLIDAKWIFISVDVEKEVDVPGMRERLRTRLVSGLKFGLPIHIAMSNSAVMLKTKYCSSDEFPEALFKQKLWFDRETYSKVIRETDLSDWPGAFPGRMKDDCASYVLITTDFDLESAHEYLPGVLPYFEDMALIEIDPDTASA